MILKKHLLNLSLSACALILPSAKADVWLKEFYSQTVMLHQYADNPITQNKFSLIREGKNLDWYAGVWFDHDVQSDADQTYTDAQISPLIGLRSKVFGNEWMYSRFFLEGRLVHRTKAFVDERPRTTYELRPGLMGYGLKLWENRFFLENYYALFFSRLYDERVIFQGWARQGIRVWKPIELFNEIFADTFDLTRDTDASFSLRPGIRLRWDFEKGSFQLLHQRIHHFTNLDFNGRNESRSTLVLGVLW